MVSMFSACWEASRLCLLSWVGTDEMMVDGSSILTCWKTQWLERGFIEVLKPASWGKRRGATERLKEELDPFFR